MRQGQLAGLIALQARPSTGTGPGIAGRPIDAMLRHLEAP